MFRALSVAALIIAAPVPAFANAIEPAQDAVIQGFFAELKANRVQAAYEALFSGTVMTTKQQEMQMLIAQTSNVLAIYGKIAGWELVRAEPISPSFARAIYLMKTEGVPVFYAFEFYKKGTGWVVTRVTFNDNYAIIVGQAKP